MASVVTCCKSAAASFLGTVMDIEIYVDCNSISAQKNGALSALNCRMQHLYEIIHAARWIYYTHEVGDRLLLDVLVNISNIQRPLFQSRLGWQQ